NINPSGVNQAGWVFPSGNPSEISRFSGVTYYFGLKLMEHLPGIPIGIIEIPLDRLEDYKGLRMVRIDPLLQQYSKHILSKSSSRKSNGILSESNEYFDRILG
ncbi:MAG: hypothetical protein JKY15_07350, partial [Deltaproteobacteria bacterium]|nr:hypothetical protein [Deltaproteobacteria bacterium]